MRFSVLGSGSKGNSVYIESGDSALLIDAGFSGKQVESRLLSMGRGLESVRSILLTHEHNDHIHGAGILSRRCHIPVHANVGTFRGAEKRLGRLHARREFETGETFSFECFEIRSFPVLHDTLDPVGFTISDGEYSIGYLTDTGKTTHLMGARLKGCDALILEFNHDLEMLKNGPYPLPLQQRVRSSHGHLANGDAAQFLDSLQHINLQYTVLAHLSETNNLPELAFQEAKKVNNGSSSKLVLAEQNRALEIIDLAKP